MEFLPFRPGLVGGHCIGVDPYYLIHKSQNSGYNPTVISSARYLNDKMGDMAANRFIKKMKSNSIKLENSRILIMGLTFKENCPDLRNAGIFNVITKLKKKKCILDFYEPLASEIEIKKIYGKKPIKKLIRENMTE